MGWGKKKIWIRDVFCTQHLKALGEGTGCKHKIQITIVGAILKTLNCAMF